MITLGYIVHKSPLAQELKMRNCKLWIWHQHIRPNYVHYSNTVCCKRWTNMAKKSQLLRCKITTLLTIAYSAIRLTQWKGMSRKQLMTRMLHWPIGWDDDAMPTLSSSAPSSFISSSSFAKVRSSKRDWWALVGEVGWCSEQNFNYNT